MNFDKYWDNSDKSSTATAYKERFLVKQGQRLISIPVNQVAYFFSQERFIFLKTFDNQKFLLEYRIEQLENLLSPAIFFRINRSFIISLPTVKEIHSYFGIEQIILTDLAGRNILIHYSPKPGAKLIEIDVLEKIQPGIYIIHIRTDKSIIAKTIFRE